MRQRSIVVCLTAALSTAAVSSLDAATLTLAWDATPGAEGYVVRYGPRTAPFSGEAAIGPQTTYTFSSLPDNQTYCFVVHARAGGILSDASNQVCALVDPPPSLPIKSDFNFDSRNDLVWQHHGTGQISTWTMNGTVMTSGVLFSPGRVADTNWKIVGRGDMNGDGMTDLVWHHQGQGLVSTWLMNGTTMIAGVLLSPSRVADTNWRVVGVADANGDTKPDLYWHHRTTGMVSVWLMDGTSLIDGIVLSPDRVADTDWQVAGVGDMNRDGYPDLVWQHQTSGLISTWYMRGSRALDFALLSPSQVSDLGWKIRSVSDLDGDGQTDLIWQHQTSGLISTWLMNGIAMRAGVLLTPMVVPDTNWKIAR